METQKSEKLTMNGFKKIYVLSEDGGHKKIGISNNVQHRKITLRHGRGKLSIVSTYTRNGDARLVERIAHTLLAEKRISGEWFDVTDDQANAAIRSAIQMVDHRDFSILGYAQGEYPGKGIRAGFVDNRDDLTERKSVDMPESMWRDIAKFQASERIASGAEALRRIVTAGLRALGVEKSQ